MYGHASARTLLGPLDPDPVGRLISELARTGASSKLSESLADAYSYVKERIGDSERPVVTTEQARAFDGVFRSKRSSREAPIVESLAVNLYARATMALRARPGAISVDDLAIGLDKVKAWFDGLERGALGDFLIDAEIAAAQDDNVAQAVDSAAMALTRIGGRRDELENGIKVALRQKDPDEDECWCIVSACNVYDDCRNFCIEDWLVCVLIFIGIILVIILG